VSAALGIEIVDEAVFALSEKQPGFERFSCFSKELLTPRYEVHQFSFEKVLLDDFEGEKPVAQRGALRVLLAAAGAVRDKDVRVSFGREAIEAKRGQYLALYAGRLNERAQEIARAMTAYYEHHEAASEGFSRDLKLFAAEGNAQSRILEDPWGNSLIGDGKFTATDYSYLTLRSMGPDRRADTADDIGFQVYAQRKPQANASRYAPFKGRATVHDNAIGGGRVAIEGTVKDKDGNEIGRIKASARRVSNGMTTSVYTDASGRFTIPNLAPGSYHLVFEGGSYQPAVYRTLVLNAGARGVVEAVLGSPVITPVTLTAHLNYSSEFGEAIGRAGGRLELMRKFERKDFARLPAAQMAADGAPPPMAGPKKSANAAEPADEREQKEDAGGGEPRVRSFFPETLYTNPSLITDGQGRATIHVPMADSITTWRITSLASTTRGALGSSTAPIRVFQDFFVDLDLPVSLTEGDVVSVPVAVYNYLPNAQTVSLELRQDLWFALDNDSALKQVEVKAGEVTSASFG
jgi:hypothetical protein